MSATELIGRGWAFPPQFRAPQTGPEMKQDNALLEQSIYVVLNTQVGERTLNPTLGAGLHHFMFQEASPLVLTELKQEIAAALLEHEPRIKLRDIQFDLAQIYAGQINIVLTYTIKQTNARSNMVFPFYLAEKSI